MSQFFQSISDSNLPPDVPTSFVTDSGTVIPDSHIVNVNGDIGITVIANPNGSNNMLIQLTEVAAYVNVTAAMSPYDVTGNDYYISVDASGGPVTINLPDTPTNNTQFIVKDRLGEAGTNPITIKSKTAVSTIDNQPSYVFNDDYESLECIYHDLNYEIF